MSDSSIAGKTSFVIYTDWLEHFELLSLEERGVLITFLFNYVAYNIIPADDVFTPGKKMAFSFMRATIDRDIAKYANKCEQNRKNGAKGGAPIGNQNARKQPDG